jgi:hypothetical protein
MRQMLLFASKIAVFGEEKEAAQTLLWCSVRLLSYYYIGACFGAQMDSSVAACASLIFCKSKGVVW